MPPGINARLGGFDLNLRPRRRKVAWRELTAERATLDAALEKAASPCAAWRCGSGSWMRGLRRAATRRAATASRRQPGICGAGAGAAAAAAGRWAGLAPLLAQPLALRLSGSGAPAEALALRGEGDLGSLRAEATATLDTLQSRGSGTLTLRHPGAPRLLAPLRGRRRWPGSAPAPSPSSPRCQGRVCSARRGWSPPSIWTWSPAASAAVANDVGAGRRPTAADRPLSPPTCCHCLSCRCAGPSRCGWTGSARSMPSWRWRQRGWSRPAPWCWTPPARH